MIEVKDVSLSFKDRSILEHVNLSVKKHDALGIIGPSGAGKSIFLKMIAGLITPTSGSIEVLSDRLGMLFQKNALFDSFSLLNNLLLPLSETMGITGSDAEDRSMKMLKAVGLDHAAHLFPDEISGGMQKRLGIARALIIEPEVILYDEPTAGLDPITSKSIAELMLSLHEANQTTLVMVTNDLQRAYQVSGKIAFCNDRKLTILGTPDEVKATTDPEVRRFIYSSALQTGPSHGGHR
jgi:phospholipid/cholesterol/gamma-HCH transport system ATP-binding protein